MAHVSDKKKKIVKEFEKLFLEYPIIASVNMQSLPAPQLQTMREQLRGNVIIRMAKRRLFKIIIENVKNKKPGIEKLIPYLKGMPALIFTKDNPFALFKTLERNKSPAPAKAGQIAPKDIVVPAGPTPFAPGPIIGELGQVGIKAGIESGKVAIKSDKVVVKEGEIIKPKIASILTRLNITPMEIGLDLVAAYDDGDILTKDILAVDEKEYLDKITTASKWAINLAIEAAIPNNNTVELLIQKAFRDAKALAIQQKILAKEIINDVLAKVNQEALSLKKTINV